MSQFLSFALLAVVLVLIQAVAALPWIMVLVRRPGGSWLKATLAILALVVTLDLVRGLLSTGVATIESMTFLGRLYGSVLHLQLLADLFVGIFALLLTVWPKGGAVALSAFREGLRQPMFWLILLFAVGLMIIIPFVPYFTFGEDHLMVRELGQDVIMLGAVVFGAILASTSISEEIEGRTAVTLMSKPVSRRQFLLGKYVGILLATLVITLMLGWLFNWMMLFTHWYEKVDPVPFPAGAATFIHALTPGTEREAFLQGLSWWGLDAANVAPGLVLGFGQVMVLLAIAVCLATRLPVVANVVSTAVLYVVSHLAPVLVASVKAGEQQGGNPTVTSMLKFVAQLFDRILPALQLFKPTQITDAPPALGDMAFYSGEVMLYALLYTAIVLLFGLVLFEDRDLA